MAIPEIHQFELEPGDRILLCSDGLYKRTPEQRFMQMLAEDKTAQEIINDFDSMCAKKQDDNYTGVLAILG